MNPTPTEDHRIDETELELGVVLDLLREWQEANRLAGDVQASLPARALDLIRSAGVQTPEDIRARWVAAVAGLHPDVVSMHANLLDYVVGVVEDLEQGRTPTLVVAAPPTGHAERIAELEARVHELETMIAGAAAVLREADA